MLSPADVLRLPYDDSLTLAGIEYAKKSLHYTFNRMGLSPAARLRKIVAGVAVELAFRRWLDAQAIPYDLLGATPFTEKDRYDLCLGGRRCDVKSFLITAPRQVAELRREPAWLMDATALVPEDQFDRPALGENDLYLFGFLAGRETRQRAEVQKAVAAGQPVYLLHTPAEAAWLGREGWRPLGRLALKSRLARPITVEIGGQDEARAAVVERLTLPPRTRLETQHTFYSLLYVRVPRLPEAVLGVHSPALKLTRLIAPADWSNIWVYGEEVFMAGWLTKGEFRALSRRLPLGAPVKQYRRTQAANRAVPVEALRPLAELTALVRQSGWGAA